MRLLLFLIISPYFIFAQAKFDCNTLVDFRGGLCTSMYSTFKPVNPEKNYFFEATFMRQVNNFQGGITVSNTSVGFGASYDFNSLRIPRPVYTRVGANVCYRYIADFQTLDGDLLNTDKHVFICPYVEERVQCFRWLYFYGKLELQSFDGLSLSLGTNIHLNFN